MPTASRILSWKLIFSGAVCVSLFVGLSGAHADQFVEQKQQAIERCQAVDEKTYSTGMIFNPKGQVTMFERSRCFQELAAAERDPSLCDKVVERKSWFFDGSAISEKSCLERMAQRIEKDALDFASKDFSLLHRLRSAAFARNGNGKDFDFALNTEGSMSGAYELELSVSRASGGEDISIVHNTASRFGGTDSRKTILLMRSQLTEILGETFQQTEWTTTVTLQFAKTRYNRFYYSKIPPAFRSSRLETRLHFADLPPWKLEPIK
jgi:hypothetical protein